MAQIISLAARKCRLIGQVGWPLSLFLVGLGAPWLFSNWPGAVSQAAVGSEIVGRASIIDGDTIEIRGQRIRLHGIDAPENGQSCRDGSGEAYRCGKAAAFALAEKIGGRNVRCNLLDRDRYGRHVGRCFIDETDLNAWIVGEGHALAYRHYSMEYVPAERLAREKRIGAWQGDFEVPSDWRRGDRRGAEVSRVVASEPVRKTGCAIKGNINGNGRIYHLPGQQFYNRTTINPAEGERWFCSEAEAQAAGWRRALR
jgi:endonuclease YncB( thermonuclease family)